MKSAAVPKRQTAAPIPAKRLPFRKPAPGCKIWLSQAHAGRSHSHGGQSPQSVIDSSRSFHIGQSSQPSDENERSR
eukprot:COSAG02_NODE_2226_length_9456_cov_6.430587_3_plen_76_part_00